MVIDTSNIKIDEKYSIKDLEQAEAFSSRIRFRILINLVSQPKTSAQLARDVEISRPKAHYHLQVLVKLGLASFVCEKLVNGIMEKYYIGKAHFYSFDDLDLYAAQHPEDTVFAKKLKQIKNDALANILDLSHEKVSIENEEHSFHGNNYLFNFQCHMTEEQTLQVNEKLGELSKMILEFHAQNIERPDYSNLPKYMNTLLLVPLTGENIIVQDDL